MRIACLDGHGFSAVGGALRGREMSFALSQLGHQVVRTPHFSGPDLAALKPDAVIETGTWHQLQVGESSGIVVRTRLCDEQGIPSIWWYGSNGSVWGVRTADEKKRRESEEKVLSLIRERPFIGVICPYSMGIYARYAIPMHKMRLIPSVFDGELFTPAKSEYDERVSQRLRYDFGLPEGKWCIGTVGNTPNSKGGDFIIKAMKLLEKEMPDLHYVILHTPEASLGKVKAKSPEGQTVGNSELDVLQDSKRLALDLGLGKRVHFIGLRFMRTGMPAFYRLLNGYCSPSEAENLGQPLVESQLCGLPLVTFKGFSFDFVSCPHSATQVEPHHTETDDYGLVIPKGDPVTLAAAIRRQREMGETEGMSQKTRQWTHEKFHHHNATKMVNAIKEYQEMIK